MHVRGVSRIPGKERTGKMLAAIIKAAELRFSDIAA
jgi:hypothetical protein